MIPSILSTKLHCHTLRTYIYAVLKYIKLYRESEIIYQYIKTVILPTNQVTSACPLCALAPQGCCKEGPHPGWLRATELARLAVPEGRRRKPGAADRASPEPLGRDVWLRRPQALSGLGRRGCSLCRRLPRPSPACLRVSVWSLEASSLTLLYFLTRTSHSALIEGLTVCAPCWATLVGCV